LAGLGSAAWGLNNQDEVVGYSEASDSNSNTVDHAFLYKHGKMIDLGTLGGTSSAGIAINNHGEITGDANTTSGAVHAFLYNHGHMTDLGTLGGTTTEAFAINDSGDVVGFSNVNATSAHGFLYENGKMIDLNSLIPAGSPYTITDAEAINNHGQIAATAISTNTSDQSVYVVLLNPKGRNIR
jgi:probable HAF family extracellular repeat protein